jgi:hypothetical protein
MDLDAYRELPIPPWLELSCPKCAYPLRGLPEHRCPECGLTFYIDDLITPLTPLRPPEITARTRPVPDLGLICGKCEYPLKGLPGDRCPECGEAFSLTDFVPPEPWGEVAGAATATEAVLMFSRLRSAGIPCLLEDAKGVQGAHAADVMVGGPAHKRLRVRRDYYLDALAALSSPIDEPGESWTCPGCSEEVPGNFDICWKCQRAREE